MPTGWHWAISVKKHPPGYVMLFTLHYFTLYYVTLRYVALWYIKLLFTLCTLRYLHYVFANFYQLFNVSIATVRFYAFIASTAPNIM